MSGTLRSSLAEFMGTFGVVWLSASAAVAGPVMAALAYGLAMGMVVFAFGSADAHFNPALTAALVATKRLDGGRGVLLIFAQLLGSGLAGLFLVKSFHAQASAGACVLTNVGFRMGTLVEAMAAFWVTLVYCKARLEGAGASGAAALGAATTAVALATAPLTGGAFNPARAFGPAVALGQWPHWYVYWAGPLVGAAAAAVLYEHLFAEAPKEAA